MQSTADKISEVYQTIDYTMFHKIAGNRNVNELHVERLVQSMEEKQLITPIIVNEKYEIIDGQHRYEAISRLNLPLYFILCEGYGLNEVHRLNERSNTWNLSDFLNGYATMGKHDYILLQQFIRKNNITPNLALFLTKGDSTDQKAKKDFKDGTFSVNNLEEAQSFLNCLNDFKDYFPDYKMVIFIKAFKKVYDSKKYNHSNMIKKLEYMGGSLQARNSQEQYIEMLCEIYNMRLKANRRIYFDGLNEIQI